MGIKAGTTLIQMNVAFRVVLWWLQGCVQELQSGVTFVRIGRNSKHSMGDKK